MKLLDPNDPFYRPLWRRIVNVVIVFGWAVLEAVNQHSGWALIFFAIGIWCSKMFFYQPGNDG